MFAFRGMPYIKNRRFEYGEKGRVAFAKLILSGANLLVLDEPTNYMDIESKENIEEALDDFEVPLSLFPMTDILSEDLPIEFSNYRIKNYLFMMVTMIIFKKYREQRLENQVGRDFQLLTEEIQRLELELAFIGGKLNGKLNEEEREKLNKRFLEYAQELNRNKNLLKNYK